MKLHCPSLNCTKWEASIELAANLRAERLRACAGRRDIDTASLSAEYRTLRGTASPVIYAQCTRHIIIYLPLSIF